MYKITQKGITLQYTGGVNYEGDISVVMDKTNTKYTVKIPDGKTSVCVLFQEKDVRANSDEGGLGQFHS